jgi:hypothetical protein
MPKIYLVMPEQYGYRWIDLDEYYQSFIGLNSIGGIPEELKAKTETNFQSIKMGWSKEWPRREPTLRGASRNRHTPNELCAWLIAPSHSHAVMVAINEDYNAAGLLIPAQGGSSRPLWHELGLPEVKAGLRTKLRLGLWYLYWWTIRWPYCPW